MATKQEIITAIDGKIIAKGNITAVDTNKILKDILEFSDKPVTPINGFDFGNVDKPLSTKQLATVKVNFTGIDKFSCSLYICTEARLKDPANTDVKNNPEWLFIPLKEEEYKILLSFLPNINEKQMYITFTVPFFRAEFKDATTPNAAGGLNSDTRATVSRADFPMTIIGIGLLENKKQQKGVHLIIPEAGHISTSMALLYKPNKFEFGLFTKEMQDNLDKMFSSILEDNDLIID
ncbi:hypothetical protein DOS84_01055 [Flavobacterium aquariorum]|uniref:Uncharacterized protein n=1 Tax=Flavobacterium aquariorum TaxID=2217670 RepID=A0A2W7UJ48_9FLAO|nr:hypothetical protein [Flavobacterium aquariorum]PZX95187.1 hypothetical protein DOS84_01055 [Flavobacterium aquariorum]